MPEAGSRQLLIAGSALVLLLLAVSGLQPYDRATWVMETLPVMIVLPVLWARARRFPLTPLLYWLVFLHCAVLIAGGAYTYARVPLGNWLQDVFELARNPYDKIGHFFQGLVPAIAAREIFLRRRVVNGRGWLAFLCVCTVMTVSAGYELLEWAAAVAMDQGADEFLGLQGDEWDAQSDMLWAFIGALAALATLSGCHDRQLARIEPAATTPGINPANT